MTGSICGLGTKGMTKGQRDDKEGHFFRFDLAHPLDNFFYIEGFRQRPCSGIKIAARIEK